MSLAKKNTIRQSKKNLSGKVVVAKTLHSGEDLLFKEKLAEANTILAKTRFLHKDDSSSKKNQL